MQVKRKLHGYRNQCRRQHQAKRQFGYRPAAEPHANLQTVNTSNGWSVGARVPIICNLTNRLRLSAARPAAQPMTRAPASNLKNNAQMLVKSRHRTADRNPQD